jgi:hypothetical protein
MTTPPLPDYFELLRQMTGGGATPNAGIVFDPAKIDKKIRELEVVHMWLTAQTNAVALSIKALEFQRDTLATMKSTAAQGGNADLTKLNQLFDPAAWMRDAMAGLQAGASPSQGATRAKRTTKGKK